MNVLYSHPVFPICPRDIGSYRKRSIKRRGAYFIFHVKGAALIGKRHLFQLRVKHLGEYQENSELGKKKDKYERLELLYEPGFEGSRALKL